MVVAVETGDMQQVLVNLLEGVVQDGFPVGIGLDVRLHLPQQVFVLGDLPFLDTAFVRVRLSGKHLVEVHQVVPVDSGGHLFRELTEQALIDLPGGAGVQYRGHQAGDVLGHRAA